MSVLEEDQMDTDRGRQHGRVGQLEHLLLAFFVVCALSLVLVYLIDPSLYTAKLLLTSSPTERYPLPASLFLGGVLVFIAVVMVGVMQHWRWVFWLLLVAFACSILEIPATLLQVMHVLPGRPPLWYGLYQMSVALLETGFALWMIRVYRSHGVWAMGKKKAHRNDI